MRSDRLLANVCVVLLLAGAVLDTATVTSAAPACDNKCRMRQTHLANNGNCYQFAEASCLLCQPGKNYLCKQLSSDGGGTCTDVGNTIVYKWDDCAAVCTFGTGTVYVEANSGGTIIDTTATMRQVCQ